MNVAEIRQDAILADGAWIFGDWGEANETRLERKVRAAFFIEWD